MTDQLRWYDSVWLGKYLAAKDIIASVAPDKLQGFVDSFDRLRTEPSFTTKYLSQFFDASRLGHIKELIRTVPREKLEFHEMKRFGRFIVHNFPAFSDLQQTLVDDVSVLAGEEVEPSYNFLSLYRQMGICEPHLDAPSAKWTLDVCIEQSDPWPIYFSETVPWPEERLRLDDNWKQQIKSDCGLSFEPQVLLPGDAVLFSGSSQWHYRDEFPAKQGARFCNLLFFHFIPKGTSELVRPSNWARLYAVPELSEISPLDHGSRVSL